MPPEDAATWLDYGAIGISLASFGIAIFALIQSSKRLELAERGLKQSSEHMARSAELQALVHFRSSARDFRYSDGIEEISNLNITDWNEYKSTISESSREKIRNCVEHLNFVASLVYAEHVKPQIAWDLYFMSYRLVAKNLDPWWFDGMSKEHPNRFISSRRMAKKVMEKSEKDIKDFDEKRLNKLDKLY